MTIDVIHISDICNPKELRDWYTEHSTAQVSRIINIAGVFYIFYE